MTVRMGRSFLFLEDEGAWCCLLGEDVALGSEKLMSVFELTVSDRTEYVLLISIILLSNIHVEKFGRPHEVHSQLMLVNALNMALFMPIQFL